MLGMVTLWPLLH
ncbi:unnamed protein product [Linum tenue]|uniref:Uncharacterized protein n=1 Tax=Linum tenue TaxID=586396 RepID=A0AAV0NP57_9ROSI|nr:unnamed protein product [Linum tenue]